MKIHLGCGDHIIPGYLNIDMQDRVSEDYLQWDLRQPLPLTIKNVQSIVSEHFWEHLDWHSGLKLMKSCKDRMLNDAVFSLALPNFNLLVKKYLEKDWNFFRHCLVLAPDRQLMQVINYSLYQYVDGIAEHKQMYDVEYALFTMKEAGFKSCREVEFNPLYNIESRKEYTFYCEGLA